MCTWNNRKYEKHLKAQNLSEALAVQAFLGGNLMQVQGKKKRNGKSVSQGQKDEGEAEASR